jgi:two-component system, LytTR family, sensor kinase
VDPRPDPPLIANPWTRWAVMVGVWTGLALFFVSQSIVRRMVFDVPINWKNTAGYEFVYWYIWAALTPGVLWLARRYRLTRVTPTGMGAGRGIVQPQFYRNLAIHSAAGLFFSAIHAVVGLSALITWFGPIRGPDGVAKGFADILRELPAEMFTGFYKYWLIVIIYWALDYHRKYRQREVEASQLESKLAQAQLQALKMQLHPHFLFNTLHAVSMLNFTDVDAANRMLVQLSDLLRLTLENSGAHEVRLRSELDFLRRYLEIEQTRFQDRLTVQIDADPRLLDAYVPNLILQPLVENAIRHGVGPLARPGRVVVRVARNENDLILEVRDDGAGLPAGWDIERNAGIGLSNTSARLRQLYGDRHSFALVPGENGGVVARIVIPLSFAAPDREDG